MLLLHVVIMNKLRHTKLFGKRLVHLWEIYFCISIKFFNYIVSFHATLTCGENEQTQAQKIMFKASSLSLRNATTVYLFLSHRFFYSCMWWGWTNTWTWDRGGREVLEPPSLYYTHQIKPDKTSWTLKGAFKYYVSKFWGVGGLSRNADTADDLEGEGERVGAYSKYLLCFQKLEIINKLIHFFLNHALISLNTDPTPQNIFLTIIERPILIFWNMS